MGKNIVRMIDQNYRRIIDIKVQEKFGLTMHYLVKINKAMLFIDRKEKVSKKILFVKNI